jgi:hypothetical protein
MINTLQLAARKNSLMSSDIINYGWLKKKRGLSEKILSDFIKFL